jgi:hypothetical protein
MERVVGRYERPKIVAVGLFSELTRLVGGRSFVDNPFVVGWWDL